MNLLQKLVDERFLDHRRRSSSVAGIAGGVTAIGLFAWRYYVDHRWSNDLLAVALVFVGVKVALMAFYTLRD